MKNLAQKIIEYRAKYGLSVEKFASIVGVSASTILSIEKRQALPLRTTEQKILNVIGKEDN